MSLTPESNTPSVGRMSWPPKPEQKNASTLFSRIRLTPTGLLVPVPRSNQLLRISPARFRNKIASAPPQTW
jgi:hypothetical protein